MADFLSNSFTLIICIIIILPILPLIISLLRDIFQKNTNVDNTTHSTYENINEPEHIHVYINGKCTKCGKTDPTHNGIVKKCAVGEYPKSEIDRYQAA